MQKFNRTITPTIEAVLRRGKSVLLLGPRQVGKTTLLIGLPVDLTISLARPAIRQQYEQDIESFSQEIEALAEKAGKKPLVAVDEIQKVPELMDATQDLIDRRVAQFILTGSSARKLKKQQQLNWLPGRVAYFHLDPLTTDELPKAYQKLEEIDLRLLKTVPDQPRLPHPSGRDNRDITAVRYIAYQTPGLFFPVTKIFG